MHHFEFKPAFVKCRFHKCVYGQGLEFKVFTIFFILLTTNVTTSLISFYSAHGCTSYDFQYLTASSKQIDSLQTNSTASFLLPTIIFKQARCCHECASQACSAEGGQCLLFTQWTLPCSARCAVRSSQQELSLQ